MEFNLTPKLLLEITSRPTFKCVWVTIHNDEDWTAALDIDVDGGLLHFEVEDTTRLTPFLYKHHIAFQNYVWEHGVYGTELPYQNQVPSSPRVPITRLLPLRG